MRSGPLQMIATCFLPIFLASSCKPDLPPAVSTAYEELPDQIDFNFHVRPILSDRCFSCHGPDENARKAELRLDLADSAFAALASGAGYALVPESPDKSVCVQRILSDDPEFVMPPPDSKLTLLAEEKATIVKWIEQGAEWKPHWSFIPPKRPSPPVVSQPALVKNAIDRFVLAKLESKGLAFSREATRETLIRRLSLDLTGLPPTPQEVEDFVNDDAPHAYEELVDDLLGVPAFGERWAWDWLDAARYADTNGFQGDPERTTWPWRDWVVRAINDNMPYDRFTIEQLAGDLLPDPTTEQMLATAFNRNHMFNGEGGRIPEETRVENVFDRVETTGTIWLGLTVNCCRCHDHKFDQLTQREYYQLYDYFNQTSEEGIGVGGNIEPVLDLSPPEKIAKIKELQAFIDEIAVEVDAYEENKFPHRATETPADSPAASNLNGDDLYGLTFSPARRNPYHIGLISATFKESDPTYSQLLDELRKAKLNQLREASENVRVMVMDEIERPRPTFILDKGAYDKPKERVERNVPSILPPLPDGARNNRLALAKWLVSPDHPLTARVTVNRFWQSFFGTGLVKTVEDFGVQGELPSHPQLLDWLAVEFMESGWDVKQLFKTIVMSATYRQSSKVSPASLEIDPENRLLTRSSRFRLPSWMIRDQALFVSGLLSDSIGGPPVKPYQPEGIWAEATFGKKKYHMDSGEDLYRRSIYTFWRRIVGPTNLFDNSARQVCSVRTIRTNSPLHALTTLNDVTYAEAARVMAERVIAFSNGDIERLTYAFRLTTARIPGAEEISILLNRLAELRATYQQQPEAAHQLVSVGEYPINTSIDVLEHAAFTAICSLLLNLDETLTRQ